MQGTETLMQRVAQVWKDQGVDVTVIPALMYSSLLYCTPNLIHTAEDKIMSTF